MFLIRHTSVLENAIVTIPPHFARNSLPAYSTVGETSREPLICPVLQADSNIGKTQNRSAEPASSFHQVISYMLLTF